MSVMTLGNNFFQLTFKKPVVFLNTMDEEDAWKKKLGVFEVRGDNVLLAVFKQPKLTTEAESKIYKQLTSLSVDEVGYWLNQNRGDKFLEMEWGLFPKMDLWGHLTSQYEYVLELYGGFGKARGGKGLVSLSNFPFEKNNEPELLLNALAENGNF